MKRDTYSYKDFSAASLNINLRDRIKEFQKYIDQSVQNDHKIYWIEANSGLGPEIEFIAKKTGKTEKKISFIANDYLGMSQRKETIDAGMEAIRKYGTGVCAAPSIGGFLDIHRKLEDELALFLGFEAAMIFSTGYGVNSGIISALLSKQDLAIIDTGVHTSVIDGLRGLNVKMIPHNSIEHLEYLLKREQNNYTSIMVIIDGIYSQDGDLGPIEEIHALCKEYNALLYIDDAHGIGVMGENGKGSLEYLNKIGQVDILTGTFSKSFGAIGGFVAGSRQMIQYLKYFANTSIFSASITPQVTCSVMKALEIIQTEKELRLKLWDNTNYIKKRLYKEGFEIKKSDSPIIPLMVRDDFKAKEITRLLWEQGFYALAIIYPAVRRKEARIRLSISATHTKEQIDLLVNALNLINEAIPIK